MVSSLCVQEALGLFSPKTENVTISNVLQGLWNRITCMCVCDLSSIKINIYVFAFRFIWCGLWPKKSEHGDIYNSVRCKI